MTTSYSLSQLGWLPFFQQQLTLDEWEQCTAWRVVAQHRSTAELLSEKGPFTLELEIDMPPFTVGDWMLLNHQGRFQRLLDRQSLFTRRASGTKVDSQLIAANVDTVFVVCSLNDDFSLNRIERYLSLTKEARVETVVVLTKSDLCEDPHQWINQVQSLNPLLMVEAVNALDANTVTALEPWCQEGKTIALLGSSGVGKSTLVNVLMRQELQQTSSIRQADSKGRHTTTGRSLHFMPSCAILLDTPGMRELQISDCEQGVKEVFADIGELESQCRYSNCQHEEEPGCAVLSALEAGELDERRLNNYRKLLREQTLNSSTLAEKRSRDRNQSRYYRSVQAQARKRKEGSS